MAGKPIIRAFFDEPTHTVSYLVADPATGKAAVIDPVLDYDPPSGEVDTRSVDAMLTSARGRGSRSCGRWRRTPMPTTSRASPYVKAKTGAKIGIGEHIKDVQRIFRPIFNATDLKTDGSDFDHLFKDGERFTIGELDGRGAVHARPYAGRHQLPDRRRSVRRRYVVHARFRHRAGGFPGRRRPSALSLDQQAARAAGGDAAVHVPRLQGAGPRPLRLGDHASGRSADHNVHVGGNKDEDAFVAMRTERDATLAAPKLLLPSIQVNIRAGRFPPAHANGVRYLRIPVKFKGGAEQSAV